MTCEHKHFRVIADINHITREETGERVTTVAEFAVFCKDCKMPFRFNWTEVADPNLIPLNTDLMQKAPWSTAFMETLCCTIEPFPEGKWFGESEQVGHA